MQAKFITKLVARTAQTYCYPDSLTRQYARADFSAVGKGEVTVSVVYDFAFDLFVNGKCVFSGREGVVVDVMQHCKQGKNMLGIRMYLSDNAFAFMPALSVNVMQGKEQLLSTKEVKMFSFISFYTDYEPEDWATSTPDYNSGLYYNVHPKQILRPTYFKHIFNVNGKVVNAVLKMTARGSYIPFINGVRIGNQILAPGICSDCNLPYPHKAAVVDYYQTYNITEHFIGNQSGENGKNDQAENNQYVLCALVAGGFYTSLGFNTIKVRALELAAELTLTLHDGSTKTILTSNEWITAPSPILQSDLMWGERYDANLELEDFCSSKTDDFSPAVTTDTQLANLVEQNFAPIAIVERLSPVKEISNATGTIYDIGKNICGRAELKITGATKGELFTLRYAEKLGQEGGLSCGAYHDVFFHKDTHFDGKAKFGSRNYDSYKANGKLVQQFSPEFSYTGFRYIQLITESKASVVVTANQMRSNEQVVLSINTSNKTINDICAAAINSITGNFMCGLTDCPTREKNLWNGDLFIAAGAIFYVLDAKNLFWQWTRFGKKVESTAPAWYDEFYEIPYRLYQFYGELEFLDITYPKLHGLVLDRHSKANGGYYSGDELTFYGDHASPRGASQVENDFFAHCIYVHSINRAIEFCNILEQKEQLSYYNRILAEAIYAFKIKYQDSILSGKTGNNYSYCVLPLAYNMCGTDNAKYIDCLVEKILESNFTVMCGALAASNVLNVLSQNGRHDIAFSLATSTQVPSWGGIVASGATTLTEYLGGLNSSDEGDSFNHYYFSAYIEWVLKYIGGYDGIVRVREQNLSGLEFAIINFKR